LQEKNSLTPPTGPRPQQDELGEPNYFGPACVDGSFRGGAQFLLAVRAHRRAGDFSDRGPDGFYRWRDRSALRVDYEFWEVDGPAGGQNHGRGGVHFTRAS